jgi:hypothetical protein
VLMIFTGWGVCTPVVRVGAAVSVAVGTGGVKDNVGPGVGGMVTVMGSVAATAAVGAEVGGVLTTDIFNVPQERISRVEMMMKTRWNHLVDME